MAQKFDSEGIAPGQFDDADDNVSSALSLDIQAPNVTPKYDPREGENFIDEQGASDLESEETAFSSGDDSEVEAAAWDESMVRVDDEDWEIAEGDFTKSYNRLRQHVAVRTGQAHGTSSSQHPGASVAPLPATNRPRAPQHQRADRTASGPEAGGKNQRTQNDQLALFSKYNSRIANIAMPYTLGYGMGGVATNRKGASERANMKDKSDRATNEQVLDPRTRIILFKMINRGLIEEVNGCVSTGKEANVYHATTPEGQHLALKIYKTSILVFKDRDKYVTGEHRFRNGYSRHNPRKMVKMWAEKEMRNLKRLSSSGVLSPDVLEVRENVLAMSFLGDSEGWASPRLKDAEIPSESVDSLYIELTIAVRKMYHSCKLVHADLSEYNILYHDRHLYIIDVSQSVEHDHPAAFDFLRKDLKNVDDFWSRRGARTLGLRRTFDFVVTDAILPHGAEETDEVLAVLLRSWIEARAHQATTDDTEEAQFLAPKSSTAGAISATSLPSSAVLSRVDIQRLQELEVDDAEKQEDAVFLKSYIPRTLNDVFDPERDVAKLHKGGGADLIYGKITGVLEANQQIPGAGEGRADGSMSVHFEADESKQDDASEGGSEDVESSGEDDDGSENEEFVSRAPRGHRNEDKDAKKERKKAVKEEARERRKHKLPKAEKKKKIKQTSSRR